MKFSLLPVALCAGLAAAAPAHTHTHTHTHARIHAARASHAHSKRADVAGRFLSWNIRIEPDELEDGEEHWSARRKGVKDVLTNQAQSNMETLFCLQEALPQQMKDLREDLGSLSYESIGKGRDGDDKGEHTPIFYSTTKWKLLKDTTLWLKGDSAELEKPGKGWDADFNRIVTIGEFQHKSSGKKVTFMCTQLDSKGKDAQNGGAKLLVDIAKDNSNPVVLTGDFNVEPSSEAYGTLADSDTFIDVKKSAKEVNKNGLGDKTYTGFTGDEGDDQELDYMLAWSKKLEFDKFSILNNKAGSLYLSDHRAIVADIRLT